MQKHFVPEMSHSVLLKSSNSARCCLPLTLSPFSRCEIIKCLCLNLTSESDYLSDFEATIQVFLSKLSIFRTSTKVVRFAKWLTFVFLYEISVKVVKSKS